MFNKETSQPFLSDACIIASKTSINGKIFSEKDFRLDGVFSGKLECKKRVILGEKAVFKGELNCENLSIYGDIDAQVTVSNETSINSTAIFKGTLITQKLKVEEGAIFEGNCSTKVTDTVSELSTKKDSTNILSSRSVEIAIESEIKSDKISTIALEEEKTDATTVENE